MRRQVSAAILELVTWPTAVGGQPREERAVRAGAAGNDHDATVAVLGAGIMGSAMTRNLVAAMDRQDYAAEFPLEWALKDVDLAISAAPGDAPPLLAALSRQWHAAVAAGHGREDISAARLALDQPSHAG
jgi:3-hydroxyisobutyrate dehydrogenase